MKAIIDIRDIVQELEATRTAVYPNEFSGFGFVEPSDYMGMTSFKIYDWFVMDVGSYALTTIPIKDQMHIKNHPDRQFMRAWIHAHPVGNGIPGPHCWSTTDDNAIAESPMGTVPELMPWMISIVRTPLGWVGRFDVPGKQTDHLQVVPNMKGTIAEAHYLTKTLTLPKNENRSMGFTDFNSYIVKTERELEEDYGLYNSLFGDVQPEPEESHDNRRWWHRLIGSHDPGEDGDAGQDF